MRIARKALLIAVAAVATLAMTAGSASAVEIRNEDPGQHCSALVAGDHAYTGGCLLNATGTNVELRDFLGIMHVCNNSFTGRLNEAGEGFIYNQVLSGGSCGLQPCREGDGHAAPWPAEVVTGPPNRTMEAVFCVTGAFGIVANCHLNNLVITQPTHTTGTVTTGSTHLACEGSSNAVQGTWTVTSAAPGIEII
jgi:hypothetical protein